MGEEAFPANRQIPQGAAEEFIYITATDTGRAWPYPFWCWPAFDELLPTGFPPSRVRRRIFNASNLRGLLKEHVITRGENSSHVSAVLSVAGAIQVDAQEFRVADGECDLGCPSEGSEYKVWELPPCPMR